MKKIVKDMVICMVIFSFLLFVIVLPKAQAEMTSQAEVTQLAGNVYDIQLISPSGINSLVLTFGEGFHLSLTSYITFQSATGGYLEFGIVFAGYLFSGDFFISSYNMSLLITGIASYPFIVGTGYAIENFSTKNPYQIFFIGRTYGY